MSTQNVVSVVIPAYNAGKYLDETVKSVVDSHYLPIEIVVVNDGSTDETLRKAELLSQTYPDIIKIINQSNKGVSAARNNGIKNSVGKYILPLDADDLISKDYIGKAVEALNANANIKVVYGAAEFIGERSGRWKLPPFSINKLAKRNIIYVSGVYRREDFNKTYGYCEEMKGMEDWDFWISLLKNGGDVHYIDSVCFYYRIVSHSRRSNDLKNKKLIVDRLNARHPGFFREQLGGKLHYNRSWSKLLNRLGVKSL